MNLQTHFFGCRASLSDFQPHDRPHLQDASSRFCRRAIDYREPPSTAFLPPSCKKKTAVDDICLKLFSSSNAIGTTVMEQKPCLGGKDIFLHVQRPEPHGQCLTTVYESKTNLREPEAGQRKCIIFFCKLRTKHIIHARLLLHLPCALMFCPH